MRRGARIRRAVWVALLTCPVITAGQGAPERALLDPMEPARRGAKREPSKPAAASVVRRLRLESTVIGATYRSAVINGHLYSLGERHAGVEVLGIEPGRAVVRYQGEVRQLDMATSTVRSSASGAE